MIDYFRQILTSQFEAALSMQAQCVAACKPQHWDGKIANDTFAQVAYHTLYCTDLYLSPDEEHFQQHDLIRRGAAERKSGARPGLSPDDTLSYIEFCRKKMVDALAAETPESLRLACGFSWLQISRGELHIYNIRHIQHHAGQFSAYLRRVDEQFRDPKSLPWIACGWKESARQS
jgi:hypothetical protein